MNTEQKNEIGQNIKSERQWLRALFMVLYWILFQLLQFATGAVAIVQWLFVLITGKRNDNLLAFGDSLAQCVEQIVAYLTYNSEDKPFPCSEWPKAREAEPLITDEVTGEKIKYCAKKSREPRG